MRTNIVIDDALLSEARKFSKARTKRGLVEEALQTLIATRAGERRRRTYRNRLQALHLKLADLQLRQSPAALLREERDRR